MLTSDFFREKPKIIKASQKKSSRSDGEPDAKRRKVDVNETTIVQKVTVSFLVTKLNIVLCENYRNCSV